MGLKDLFISNDDAEKQSKLGQGILAQKPQVEFPTEMPQSIPSQPTQPYVQTQEVQIPIQSPEMDTILAGVETRYREGFDTLNRSGYDFYEYYKSIQSINGNNPDSYRMAFTLGQSMNPQITPQSLVEDSEYYIGEIQKVYEKFDSDGTAKKSQLTQSKVQEKSELESSINAKRQEIELLQTQLESLTKDLNSVDQKYSEELRLIDLKLEANRIAKNKFVGSLEEVAKNIKSFI